MAASPAAPLLDLLLSLAFTPSGQVASNRFAVEGLTSAPREDGTLELAIRKVEASALRVAAGALTLELDHIALHRLVVRLRVEDGHPQLCALEAASAEISGVKLHGLVALPGGALAGPTAADTTGAARAGTGVPSAVSAPLAVSATSATSAESATAATAWSLGPLAAAEGRLAAEIVDANLFFDADVTVPIQQGEVDLNLATVEHVGPNSRMGVSRLGLYVDAPNGRSYLFQFPYAPVAGVEYERRGALLGPRVTDRGKLRLQPFGEQLLRQALGGQLVGITEQARLLFARTAVEGELRLGDAEFTAPGLRAHLVGRVDGRNVVRLHSQAVGRGLTAELPSLSVRDAAARWGEAGLACHQITGALTLRLDLENAQLRFAFYLSNMKLAGLRLHLRPSVPPPG